MFLVSFVFITDLPIYRAFSPVFIYSVCLYVVVNIMSFFSTRESVLNLFKADDNISDSIFNIFMIVLLVNCTCVPVLTWIDTPKFLQYLHKWEQFQVSSNWELWIKCQSKMINFCDLSYFNSMRTEIRKYFTMHKFFIF
jgi:hypothetical protein